MLNIFFFFYGLFSFILSPSIFHVTKQQTNTKKPFLSSLDVFIFFVQVKLQHMEEAAATKAHGEQGMIFNVSETFEMKAL